MCTVTIEMRTPGLCVTMNRDERRDRLPEAPPRIEPSVAGRPGWVAPRDRAAGGTWIAVNDRGLVACLLNRYEEHSPAEPATAGRPSRGRIVPEVIAATDLDEALARFKAAFDPEPYNGFTLLMAQPGMRGARLEWDGRGRLDLLPIETFPAMFSSSSWRTEEVLQWRRERFAQWLAAGSPHRGPVPAFNVECPQGREAWAPLMSRTRSVTRSITQVLIPSAERIEMHYWDDPRRTDEAPSASRTLAAARENLII